MTHAKQPTICQACEAAVVASVDAGERLDFHYCRHRQALAFVRHEGRRIQHWQVMGPMNAQEAQTHLRQCAAACGSIIAGSESDAGKEVVSQNAFHGGTLRSLRELSQALGEQKRRLVE